MLSRLNYLFWGWFPVIQSYQADWVLEPAAALVAPKGWLLIPQLLLAHFIADYPAQTNWLFAKKIAGWPGLLMHGGVVLVAHASAVFPYTFKVFPTIFVLATIHTLQDYVKVRYGDRVFKNRPMIPYLLDQFLHYFFISLMGPAIAAQVGGPEPFAIQWTAAVAGALLVVTWTYYITWRVPLMKRGEDAYAVAWRWPGKIERMLAFVAGLLGVVYLAPLALALRFVIARQRGLSITGERYLLFDGILGVVLAAGIGLAMRLMVF